MKTNMRGISILLTLVSATAGTGPLLGQTGTGQVTLSSAAPTVAEPGLTTVRLLGSGFPVGNFNPANIQISLVPQSGGSVSTVSATQYQIVAGSTARVAFLLPAGLVPSAPALFSAAISDPTDGFSSNNSVEITITPLASISLSPASGAAGQSVNLNIVGLYSHFLAGLTQVTVTGAITVHAVNIASPTSLTVQLAVGASAPQGPQTLTVSTGAEIESAAFTVLVSTITVPNVVGDTQAVATSTITSAGLSVGTVTTQSSNTVPSGSVISQSPVGGTSVAPGSAVNLVISSGAANVTVPNVVGDTQAVAASTITGAGLIVGAVTTQSSSTVPSGSVISQSPVGGTSVVPGSAVNLVISSGAANVTVPNVVGDAQALAASTISGAGLVVGNIAYQTSSTVPVGSVISQSPTGGALVLPGSAVNLVISGQLLGTGLNEADSNLISVQNGFVGAPSLPAGQNEADSNLISVQNGTIGGTLAPAGQNEADSNLISVSNGAAATALLSRVNNLSVKETATNSSNSNSQSLAAAEFISGETASVSADMPAQLWLNGKQAGNDPNSNTTLTLVVPEQSGSFTVRPGASASSSVAIQQATIEFTGQVVDAKGAAIANANVHLRHSGLKAQFFKLSANALAQDVPSIAGLAPSGEEPVSSLNLHNPGGAFGYFPIGAIQAPNFAVALSGQFLAQTAGTYVFYLAATEGAQFTIDGNEPVAVRNTQPGLESQFSVGLAAGWHDIALLVYAKTAYAELVLTFTPPAGVRQVINPQLLRGESSTLSAVTSKSGVFTIVAPAWLDQVEAIVTAAPASGGAQSGISAIAPKGEPNFGKVSIAAQQ